MRHCVPRLGSHPRTSIRFARPRGARRRMQAARGDRPRSSRMPGTSPVAKQVRSPDWEALVSPTILEAKVCDFLAQKRIAVAGVSRNNSHHPAGNLVYRRLKKTGHDVFAVNPNIQTFEGDPCYRDLQSIPGGVDGVVIITRPEVTERIVHDCSAAGVRRVWMHQSVGKGSSVSPTAVEYCRQHDISVIAGACPMMFGDGVDFGHTCMRWILRFTGGLPT